MAELTTAEVLALLADLGQPVKAKTWTSYVAREQAPAPVRRVGREPLYDEDDIREWAANRPGRGARTDLKEPTMQTIAPAEPITRAVYGREIRVGGRTFMAVHVDGYAHVDLLVRREPRLESDRDEDRPAEWVQVERYTTLDIRFDEAARRRFDTWVDGELRAELSEPGKHLRTYTTDRKRTQP